MSGWILLEFRKNLRLLKCTELNADFCFGFHFLKHVNIASVWRSHLCSVKFSFHQNFWHFISPPHNPTIVQNNQNFSKLYTFHGIFVFSAPLLTMYNYISLIHHSIEMTSKMSSLVRVEEYFVPPLLCFP